MELSAHGRVTVTGSASLDVIRFYDTFLVAARRLAADHEAGPPEYAAAVVVAATACEVADERAVSALLEAKRPADMVKIIKGYQRRYTFVQDERLKRLWTSLSGDRIQDASFWERYTQHVKRRNEAVHQGMHRDAPVTLAAANQSITVAGEFIAHLRNVLSTNRLASYT